MAKKKSKHEVRLKKLYHYLKDKDAMVSIQHEYDGETHKTIYSENGNHLSLKDLFSHGCDVSGRALRDITEKRSFEENEELGKYARIDKAQKKVIKNIFFHFDDQGNDPVPLQKYSGSKKELYQNKNYEEYSYANISNTYVGVDEEWKKFILRRLRNDYRTEWKEGDKKEYKVATWSNEPVRMLAAYSDADTLDETELQELEEILLHWSIRFPDYLKPGDIGFPKIQSLPDIYTNISPFKYQPDNKDTLERYNSLVSHLRKLTIEDLYELCLNQSLTWANIDRYYVLYVLEHKLVEHIIHNEDFDYYYTRRYPLPKYIRALTVLITAEYSVVKEWIHRTALNEMNNVKFSVQYASEAGMSETVRSNLMSLEELCTLLEDYHFDSHPQSVFEVQHSTILKNPIYWNEIPFNSDFIYEKTEIDYAIKGKLFIYFYEELKKHIGFFDVREDKTLKNQLRDIRRDIVERNCL